MEDKEDEEGDDWVVVSVVADVVDEARGVTGAEVVACVVVGLVVIVGCDVVVVADVVVVVIVCVVVVAFSVVVVTASVVAVVVAVVVARVVDDVVVEAVVVVGAAVVPASEDPSFLLLPRLGRNDGRERERFLILASKPRTFSTSLSS